MKVEKLEREFRYNGGLRLPDPNPNLSVEEVRNLYASAYPDLTTAAIEGPEVVGNKLVYRLTRAIGTKGLRSVSLTVAAFFARASRSQTV